MVRLGIFVSALSPASAAQQVSDAIFRASLAAVISALAHGRESSVNVGNPKMVELSLADVERLIKEVGTDPDVRVN